MMHVYVRHQGEKDGSRAQWWEMEGKKVEINKWRLRSGALFKLSGQLMHHLSPLQEALC